MLDHHCVDLNEFFFFFVVSQVHFFNLDEFVFYCVFSQAVLILRSYF
jgi:hypothetical protein